jgi:carbon monoxide dehydrogenase subunit G
MAMTMQGEVALPAHRTAVWAALNDPEILKACIPGCQELEKVSDTEFQATAKIAIGPVKATFKGSVTLTDLDPPNGYTITGEGQGGVAGWAKGGAKVRLEDVEGGTRLVYDVDALVGGKIAQLGGRLINGVAKKYADEFFANFAKILSPAETVA